MRVGTSPRETGRNLEHACMCGGTACRLLGCCYSSSHFMDKKLNNRKQAIICLLLYMSKLSRGMNKADMPLAQTATS